MLLSFLGSVFGTIFPSLPMLHSSSVNHLNKNQTIWHDNDNDNDIGSGSGSDRDRDNSNHFLDVISQHPLPTLSRIDRKHFASRDPRGSHGQPPLAGISQFSRREKAEYYLRDLVPRGVDRGGTASPVHRSAFLSKSRFYQDERSGMASEWR